MLLHTPAGTGVSVLPWSEMDSLQLETGYIKDQLVALNRRGYLTINSQPGVNGASSTCPKVGWGGPNGWVSLPYLEERD
jgi:methylenetetrahydrofolate reductase (NADPH)